MIWKNAILTKTEVKARGHQARTNYAGRAFTVIVSEYSRGFKATKSSETVGFDYSDSPEPLINRALDSLKSCPKGSSVLISDWLNVDISKIRVPNGIYAKQAPFKEWDKMSEVERRNFAMCRRVASLDDARIIREAESAEYSERGGTLARFTLMAPAQETPKPF